MEGRLACIHIPKFVLGFRSELSGLGYELSVLFLEDFFLFFLFFEENPQEWTRAGSSSLPAVDQALSLLGLEVN